MDDAAHTGRANTGRANTGRAALWLLLASACGAARPAPASTHTEAVEVPETPIPETPAPESITFLDGRLTAAPPSDAPLTASSAWFTASATFEAYELQRGSCSLAFAVRSDGRLRPGDLQLGAGERWLPREGTALEILAMSERTFATLSEELAAVGAVAFEDDETAIDLWVWPRLPPGEASAEAGEDDDWLAAQRSDPRISNCFGEAERWLAELLPTLRALRPFTSPSEITFGWDDERYEGMRYRATLPAGWVLSTAEAYDAEFTFLHPRLPWARDLGTPTPNACLWLFSGDDPVSHHGRRRQVLGRALVFDAEGCAQFPVADGAAVQHLCLTGSPAEQAAILEVLETFRPVTRPE